MKAFLTSTTGLVLILIVLVGFFLRAYNFSDWLHFELDQARDAIVVDAALQGDVFDLPLLGPKAAGTALRLPPGFYHLQYLSAEIFGGSPAGQAALVLVFSVATIGAAFFLFRRFFTERLSLALVALVALSPFFVLYGRFAWNPNFLPFFLVFGAYALLRAVDLEEKRQTLWFGLATLALVLAGHFHFVAFIGVPVIVVLFLLWKRPRMPWRAWALSAGIIALLSLPMVLNDIAAEGRNLEEFFLAVTDKSGKGEHHLVEKIMRNATEQATGYSVMLTGYERAELPKFRLGPADIRCDQGCRDGLFWGGMAALLYAIGAALLFYRLWQMRHGPADGRRDFLVLMALWFVITWGLLMNVAFDLAPRFFLLVTPLPFLFLGLMLEALFHDRLSGKRLALVAYAFLFVAAGYFTVERLRDLSLAHREPVRIQGADRILKDQARVTLQQQQLIIDFIEARYRETGFPVYMHAEPQHRRALKYLLEKRNIDNDVLSPNRAYAEGSYYLIVRATSDLDKDRERYLPSFDQKTIHDFGTLVMIEFVPRADAELLPRQDFSVPEVNARDPRAAPRYSWREFWGRGEALPEEADLEEE